MRKNSGTKVKSRQEKFLTRGNLRNSFRNFFGKNPRWPVVGVWRREICGSFEKDAVFRSGPEIEGAGKRPTGPCANVVDCPVGGFRNPHFRRWILQSALFCTAIPKLIPRVPARRIRSLDCSATLWYYDIKDWVFWNPQNTTGNKDRRISGKGSGSNQRGNAIAGTLWHRGSRKTLFFQPLGVVPGGFLFTRVWGLAVQEG